MSEPGSSVIDPGEPDERVVHGVAAEQMGEEIIDSLRRVRHAEETRYRAEHPGEGLRERKRRLTRHLISDAATAMFASRGFDAVKVSEIADRANVSMKTLYNYFPTKESMVLDDADELIENLATALRDRQVGTSITDAFVAALEANMYEFDLLDDELAAYVAATFAAMVTQTPALHAHWLEIQDRLARVAAEHLALQAGTEPTDPAPMVAGWALAGLVQVDMDSRARHIRAGLRGAQLRDAVADDVRQAAELLETGLASLSRCTQTGGPGCRFPAVR
jgi:AcrR family transcriptional regulator